METPSPFYSWLCEQTAREDHIGALADHVLQDEAWPKAEAAKAPLRAHLRSHKLDRLVPALAIAFREFDEIWEEPASSGEDFLCSPIAAPAFLAWCGLGRPDRDEVAARAGNTEPAALAIHALRCLFGIKAPANEPFALDLLARAFEAGFFPAAGMLDSFYSALLDVEAANEWMLRGARAGDPRCVRTLCARVGAAAVIGAELPHLNVEPGEVAELAARHLRHSGEADVAVGNGLHSLGRTEAALSHFEKAARNGWSVAWRHGAQLLAQLGRTGEERDWHTRGAAAGEPACAGALAEEILRNDANRVAACPPEERAGQIGALSEAAEHGWLPALLPLGALYARGLGVERDETKALTSFAAALLAAETEEQGLTVAEFIDAFFPNLNNALPLAAGAEWLFNVAERSQDPAAIAAAADVWLEYGMERPRG